MAAVFMVLPKLGTLNLPKVKVFSNKSCDVIISVHGVTNEILSGESNYTA